MTNPRLTKLGWLAVSVGGLGALRPAPGTWGSLPPVAIALVAVWCLSGQQGFTAQDHTTIDAARLTGGHGYNDRCIAWPVAFGPHQGLDHCTALDFVIVLAHNAFTTR